MLLVPEWDAEIEIDEDLARRLIDAQFPSLDVRSLRRVGEGWDNTVWATGEDLAFRFPRRSIAIPGVEREMAILPVLAAHLPAPVPDVEYPGAATGEFPWPWFGSRLIEGTEIALAGLAPAERRGLAGDLGRFLGRLHDLGPSIASSLEVDPMGRADMPSRIPRTRAVLDQVAFLWDGADLAERVLIAAEDLPADGDPVLVHGDLNLRHALVSKAGRLGGVIDWGDMCRAPRCVDLPLYWSLFDAQSRTAFLDSYGTVTRATLACARVLALFFDATLALYADDKGMDELRRAALNGLDRTVAD